MTPAHVKSLLISGLYFPPQTGGISHSMAAIASALGPDQVCCLTGVLADGVSVLDKSGLRVYRRPRAFAQSKYLQALGWGTAIAQIMVMERPDVVQLATTNEGYLGLWLRHWFKVPFVIYAHGNEILAAMREIWPKPRTALCQADRILANSEYTANLVKRVGVDPDRIAVVGLGCDANRFRPLPPKPELRHKLLGPSRDGNRIILTVGSLVSRKGQDMVIRALPRLRQSVPNVTYLIVGDGPNRAHLEILATELGVRDHVHFAGRVPAEDLPHIYALCDVYVMPSRDRSEACDVEGFGLVFLEAGACGKPVVGGRSGGIPEVVADGVTGFLVDPNAPADIADMLVRLLTDRDLANRLGQQGRSRVVREFSWTRIGDRVRAILDGVSKENRRRPGEFSLRDKGLCL